MTTIKVKVTVTEEHINRGFRSNCRLCPIALALMDVDPFSRSFAGLHFVELSRCGQFTENNTDYMKARTPPVVAQFMDDFDGHRRPKPMTFDLEFELMQS